MGTWLGVVGGIVGIVVAALGCGILMGCSKGEARSGELVLDPGSFGVFLVYQDSMPAGRGSAFVLGPGRRVVTCAHAVDQGNRYQLQLAGAVADAGSNLFESRVVDLRLVKKYGNRDLAILEAADPAALEGVEPFELGDWKSLKVGSRITLIGWDRRLEAMVAIPAVVSGRGIAAEEARREYIEFEGPSQVGYSGGPVLDASGKVVAMVAEAVPLGEGRMLNIAYEMWLED